MLLAVDIGNTNISLGVFENDKLTKKHSLPANLKWEINDYLPLVNKFLSKAIWEMQNIKKVVIASVVPGLTDIFKEITANNFGFEPIIVNSELVLGIRINFDDPREIGADRLANAVAVNYLYPHRSVIVVDFGTAVTFDIIDEKQGYIGGIITSGAAMMLQALCEKTALLPQVALVKPKGAFGKNTEESMQAGIYFGIVGMVKYILKNLIKTFNGVKVVAAGGSLSFIREEIEEIEEVQPDLTLLGLWKIGELNR